MMKRTFLIFIITSFVSFLFAQGNAAEFDGISGYIEIAGATIYLPKDNLTMEAWVFPKNENPGWPDFDGIMGIRNELNCDFYLLQLNSTDIEARFRNSDGEPFSIVASGLKLNEWNHLALSFGKDILTFYLNGQYQNEVPTSGICSDVILPFTLGKLNFDGINDFYLDGKLDEVRIWSELRTEDEIAQFYNCEIFNPEDFPSLALYYNLDENDGVTSITDNGDSGVNGVVIPNVSFGKSDVEFKIVNRNYTTEMEKLIIFPNPSEGQVILDFKTNTYTGIEIFDGQGKKVDVTSTIQTDKIIINNLLPGSYSIIVHALDKNYQGRFIVI